MAQAAEMGASPQRWAEARLQKGTARWAHGAVSNHQETQIQESESVAVKWMNLEPVIQSEESQKEKNK